jgi:PAS domain S-box-containing protein
MTMIAAAKSASLDGQVPGTLKPTTRETSSKMGSVLPDGAELERLKKAVDAKMALLQQRANSAINSSVARAPPVSNRRISPIREEMSNNTPSPTLEAAFASPPTAGTTESSNSTASTESGRTIRGSVPPTPGNQPVIPMRTPSYPFPYIPGTPKPFPPGFHQPFTTLSPTITDSIGLSPYETSVSGTSTPAATAGFGPSNSLPGEDPRFPSPNLYDLVLLLNAEPSLESWWTTLTKVMRDWYGVERVTLAVPADASDLENVPWGQKATFCTPEFYKQQVLQRSSAEASEAEKAQPSISAEHSQPSKPGNLPRRPSLQTRHSYAGHERQAVNPLAEEKDASLKPSRPRGPMRTKSHAPSAPPQPEAQPSAISSPMGASPMFLRGASFSDPDFSSVGGDVPPREPLETIFSILRALDEESDPLLDNAGVNRILERGRMVTLTRDYATGSPDPEASTKTSDASPSKAKKDRPSMARQRASFGPAKGRDSGSYEEYEQYPPSPWSQSPAPSPAIQADPSENPFFSTTNVEEECFNPSATNQDYSKFGQVEAIGVDKASTIIHIPLIHPILSRPMQSLDSPSPSPRLDAALGTQKATPLEQVIPQKKAPIAILSILSPTVPYPHNLTKSLKLLAPHLATSFSNSSQYSSVHQQAIGLRQRRFLSGRHVGFAPFASEAEPLEDLLHLEIDETPGSGGSITSPSDCSALSRPSPGDSLVGTPGWDPSALGFSSRASVGGTPNHLSGSEVVDSYFDAKKRGPGTRSDGNGMHSMSGVASPSPDSRASSRIRHALVKEDDETPRGEPKPSSRDMMTPNSQREQSRSREREILSSKKSSLRPSHSSASRDGLDRKKHSRLHSYGADFATSFQSVPTAPGTPSKPNGPHRGHVRSNSTSEPADLKPPSERLLRVLIETIPVQIFTASPGNGQLTWANAKFLSYRNRTSQQVKAEPWEAIHPDDIEGYTSSWNRSLRNGQQVQQKVRLRRFDGQYRWFYVRIAPLKDKRQNLVHWAGTYMDIHDQHLAEINSARQQDTAASEAKYRALANSSPQIVFAVSKAKGVTFCNTQWLHYSGQSEKQALGIGFMDHVHPDDIVKCRLPTFTGDGKTATNVPTSLPPETSALRTPSSSTENAKPVTSPDVLTPQDINMPQTKLSQLASTGILKVSKDADGKPSYSTEVRLRSKEGQYRWHLVRVLLAAAADIPEEEETWYGTCTDINDHKLLEQTLKDTMDAKTRFLSNMSHEIRTPLNGITGMTNLLIDSSMSYEQMEQVNIIRSSTEGLKNLINDILDLSKVEAGMIELIKDWFNVRTLIEEVNDIIFATALDKGLELNYLVEENVPTLVKGDFLRLRQVLINVVGNALKFTKKGEVFVHCRVHPEKNRLCKDNETMLEFEVVDTGPGFSDDEKGFLFKRFSQIDGSSTRQHGGTGLGLAISSQLVSLHGGKMDATGQRGVGARFFFSVLFSVPYEDDIPGPDAHTTSTKTTRPIEALLAKKTDRASAPTKKIHADSQSAPKAASSPAGAEDGQSPALSSGSGSSDPSIQTAQTSIRSGRSSMSSVNDARLSPAEPIKLEMPRDGRMSRSSDESNVTLRESMTPASAHKERTHSWGSVSSLTPPIYSVLVVSPLKYSRQATVGHIRMTLPKTVPHQIADRASLDECRSLITGEAAVTFSHIVLVLPKASEVIAFVDLVLTSTTHTGTSVVVISDSVQKREVRENTSYDFAKLEQERRLRFVFKPIKPSKMALIFDPQKEREAGGDNQDSAVQVATRQKKVFNNLMGRIGNRGKKVLLVEDNHINQVVGGSTLNRSFTRN